eukprot:CAMPEP_0174259930 /NCGR_PEP_ID=MMETSP0439-20130205/8692_1 /TAXON_ID=0 /ORGANISM="Stereomyxa ramosa, Strain Chinc5" /LENGTH=665 /DNA_ID=CAMNT_0015344017 /DNA_START=32 /DNA_END=2029 /DNA_ORIENTATION=-
MSFKLDEYSTQEKESLVATMLPAESKRRRRSYDASGGVDLDCCDEEVCRSFFCCCGHCRSFLVIFFVLLLVVVLAVCVALVLVLVKNDAAGDNKCSIDSIEMPGPFKGKMPDQFSDPPPELKLTLIELLQSIRNGSINMIDYYEYVIARMDELRPLNIFISQYKAKILRDKAKQIQEKIDNQLWDELGELMGVPFAVKDAIDAKDFPTTAGTPYLNCWMPEQNSHIVSALIDAGGVLIGKLNMYELAMGYDSTNPYYGNIGNPNNGNYSAGGSSSGSAASVAAFLLPFSLGVSTGGSVEVPATLCGCVGFRPTLYRYSQKGIFPLVSTRDTPGFLARSVEDIIFLDQLLMNQHDHNGNNTNSNSTDDGGDDDDDGGNDHHNSTSTNTTNSNSTDPHHNTNSTVTNTTNTNSTNHDNTNNTTVTNSTNEGTYNNDRANTVKWGENKNKVFSQRGEKITLGVPLPFFYDDLDSEVEYIVMSALGYISHGDVSLLEADFANISAYIDQINVTVWSGFETFRDMGEYFVLHNSKKSVVSILDKVANPVIDQEIQAMRYDSISSSDYLDLMVNKRTLLQEAYLKYFQDNSIDVFIVPASPYPAEILNQTYSPNYGRNTNPGTMAGIPQISIPVDKTIDGLPVGFLLCSSSGNDKILLSVASTIHSILQQY